MLTDVRIPPLTLKGVLFFVLAGVILMAGQTSLAAWGGPWAFGPDLGLLLVLYMGLNLPATSGLALSVLVGFFKDSTGMVVLGFHPAVFLVLFLLISRIRTKIDPTATYYLVLFIFVFALAAGLLSWLFLQFLGLPFQAFPVSRSSPVSLYLLSCVITSFVGPILFGLINLLRPRNGSRSEQET